MQGQNIQNAIISFNDKHVRVVIHAGEMVSPETVKVFDGMKLIGVLGNNDLEVRELISAFDKIGGELRGEFCEIEQDKLVFVVRPVSIHYLHNRLLLFKIVIVQTISSYQKIQKPDQVIGTWDAVSQGWWVFLEPLPVRNHTLYYNIRVTPTGALTSPGTAPHFADINYNLEVVK